MKAKKKRGKANFAAIHCAHDGVKDAAEFKPHPKNWHTHPAEQLRLYAKIIQGTGWRRAVVVSKRSGFITKGHGAVLAALAHGLGPVPYEVQPYKDEAEELADLTADNKLAEAAQTDEAKLDALLKELSELGTDLELAGIDALLDEAENILQPLTLKPPPRMAWALIGIPLGRFGEISPIIEKIAALEGALVETTCNDDDGSQQKNR